MPAAERVSRRNVVSAAALALSTTEDMVVKVDELVARHNTVVDTVAKHERARMDGAQASARLFADLKSRLDTTAAVLVASDDTVKALRADTPTMRAHRVQGERLDIVHVSLVQFQTLTFFGRLRWLLTGHIESVVSY